MRALALILMVATLLAGQGPAPPAPVGLPPGSVAIPLAEYNRLVDQAAQTPRRLGAPPRPYVIQSAEFQLRVERESVTGSLQLQGEVLQKGPVRVALASGLTVLDGQQNGKPMPLAQNAGVHSALLEGPAEFQVQIGCGLPLTVEAMRASLTLPAVAAGTVRVTLSVPGDQTTVNLTPGLITESTSSGGRTTIKATLMPGQSASVWWSSRAPSIATPARELRFLSDVKTMVSVTEAEITLTALADLTVVQGEASRFELNLPAGYEVTGVTGANLASSDARNGRVMLELANPTLKSHQFLIAMAKPSTETKAEFEMPGFSGAQRETGEVLVEGEGALELAALERGGLRRMDLREVSPPLRSLADHSIYASFRYQRRPAELPGVALEWVRFPGAPALRALAERAIVTTLVTREGRSLTEMRLTVRNQSQAFARIALPPGATILSAEVAGEKVKPVEAADGSRVPLLRAGFRPTGPYLVSFVFSHAGAPFAKKGAGEIVLPKLDVPLSAVEWEVFLPEELRPSDFGGDALPAGWMPRSMVEPLPAAAASSVPSNAPVGPGEIGGTLIDASGAPVGGANILVTHANGRISRAISDAQGQWRVNALPGGRVQISADSPGFRRMVRAFEHRDGQPLAVTLTLEVGSVSESVEVNSDARQVRRQSAAQAPPPPPPDTGASTNVMDLQRRLSGVLPITVTVPRTGKAYRFVRPLVVDEETKLKFQYRSGK